MARIKWIFWAGWMWVAIAPQVLFAQKRSEAAGHYSYEFTFLDDHPPTHTMNRHEVEKIELRANGTFRYLQELGYFEHDYNAERGRWSRPADTLIVLETRFRKSYGRTAPRVRRWRKITPTRILLYDGQNLYAQDFRKDYRCTESEKKKRFTDDYARRRREFQME